MCVRDWMTCDPVVVREEDTVVAAFDLMADRRIRHLPVVDEANDLVGMLTVKDVRAVFGFEPGPDAHCVTHQRLAPLASKVGDAMSRLPLTVHPDTSLAEAARCLSEDRIGCLAVVERGRLVGVLSETDLLRAFRAALRAEMRGGSGVQAPEAAGRKAPRIQVDF